jgi:flagellin-like protein
VVVPVVGYTGIVRNNYPVTFAGNLNMNAQYDLVGAILVIAMIFLAAIWITKLLQGRG